MKAIFAVLPLAFAVTGCVSDQEYRAAQASCERPGATHMQVAKCQNAIMYASSNGSRGRDIQDLMAATREAVAAKIDRHEMTEEDGRLEVARVKAQLTSEMERRDLNQAAIVAAMTPPTPAAVYTPPTRPLNCTSTGFGNTVQTHCY